MEIKTLTDIKLIDKVYDPMQSQNMIYDVSRYYENKLNSLID